MSQSDAPAISIRNLVKRYAPAGGGEGKLALKGVSLDVPQGQIFGLLGPNGAGKSTMINIMAGMVRKTSGDVSIWGFDIDRDRRNAPRHRHRAAGNRVRSVLHPDRGAGKHGGPLRHPQGGTPVRATAGRCTSVRQGQGLCAHAVGRDEAPVAGGQGDGASAPVLVLDEPTAGVDVELRRQLWELVKRLNDEGVTVVLTTHYLEEAEELCDRIAIINHGELIANKPTREMVDMAREKIVVLTLDRPVAVLPSHPAFLKCVAAAPDKIEITYNKDKTNAGEILGVVQGQGMVIVDVTTREADLEDVFVRLTTSA
jgi:ABC-2 type transport system ATP-binding protein